MNNPALVKHPESLQAVDGGTYTLLRQPRVEGDQTFPAIYAGPEGGEFTPDLNYVLQLAKGQPEPVPLMLRFH